MVSKPLLFLALLGAAPALGAQNVRLSGSMPSVTGADVTRFWVSSDGQRAVFLVNPVADVPMQDAGGNDLYGVRTDGSQAAVLLGADLNLMEEPEITPDHTRVVGQVRAAYPNDSLVTFPIDGGAPTVLVTDYIETFRLAPGSNRAVYALGFVLGANQLYSVPLDGSQAPALLSASGHKVLWGHEFVPTADGQRVVYTTGTGVYCVPVDGSQAPLELEYDASRVIETVRVSPDGLRAVYYQRLGSSGALSLYSVPLDGSLGPVRLNQGVFGGVLVDWNADPLPFTPDGSRVFFLNENAGEVELYSVPTDHSSAAIRLHGTLPNNGRVHSFALDPQGVRVVYSADQETYGVYELYSVPVAGGQAPVKLNAPLVAGGSIFGLDQNWFAIAGDGASVAYVADQDTNDVFELYVAPIDGSAPALKLSGALVPGGDVGGPNVLEPAFGISSDGARVSYVADQASDGVFEVFAAPLDGSAPPVKLSGLLTPCGDVQLDLRVADGGRVLYRADAAENGAAEFFSVADDGSASPQRLNAPLGDVHVAGDVAAFELTPDERAVVYMADQDADESFELYRAPVGGGVPPVKLNPPFGGLASAYDFSVTPDGTRVVYTAHVFAEGKLELYSAPLAGGPAVKLNAPLAGSDDVWRFELGGTRAVYGVSFLSPRTLFTVPYDGSQPAVQLTTPGGWTETQRFGFSPDATRVVYIADQDVDGVYELFSVPSDASQPPTKLNAPMMGGRDVADFQISADSTRVVFLADALVDGTSELFAVPIAGGTPVRLSAPLVSGGNVLSYSIAPDSVGVVYLADGDADDVFELFGVSFAVPTAFQLSDALVSGGDVTDFAICPDSSRVVFRADAALDGRFELYSVPIDRSRPPLRLNGSFAPGGSVRPDDALSRAITIGPGSQRVIYRANPEGGPAADFFSVPVDRSSPPVRLTQFASGVSAPQHRLSPDGRWVVFRANLSAPLDFELHRVPVDGSEPPMTLHPPMNRNGDALDFALTSRGRAVYLADQRQDGVIELFASVIRSPANPAR